MLDPKKKVKKYVAVVILLLILAVSVSGLRIQSVKHYKEEQQRLADDIIVAETNTGAGVVAEQGNGENPIDRSTAEMDVPSAFPGKDQSAGEVTGSTEAPGASYSPRETEEKNKKSQTDKRKKENSRNSTKSDTPAKQAPRSSGRENSGTANPQKEHPKNPQQTSAVQTKATQKPSPIPTEEKKNFVCGITIRCDSMLNHMNEVEDAVKSYIPADGIILEQTSVKVETGDTAYSLLQKVCQAKDIALDASYTNGYSSAYVRGIGHIYEKQAGLSSGWLYLVNGKLPGYGASRYRLKEGDRIEWVYSCTGKLE